MTSQRKKKKLGERRRNLERATGDEYKDSSKKVRLMRMATNTTKKTRGWTDEKDNSIT